MTLQERIARGEKAIAQAKALGKDVSSWEAHLATLKAATKGERQSLPSLQGYREEVKEGKDDPVLSPDQWYPHFRDFHHRVLSETPDLDYAWLKKHRPRLYREIKNLEGALDVLEYVRLSRVMKIMRQWRALILKAEFEQRKFEREARGVDGE